MVKGGIKSKIPRIGLFGGTFNPVHCGHIKIANFLKKKLHLNEIIFVPSARPPHKADIDIIPFKYRYEMVCIATADFKGFSVSDVELKRKGKSYTIDTLRYFKKKTGADIYFIAGSDSILDITTWKAYKKLFEECYFVVVNRPGFAINKIKIPKEYFINVKIKGIHISSSEIRARISKGLRTNKLIPGKVENYIREKRLYK